MSRKAVTLALCEIDASKPRNIVGVIDAYSDRDEAKRDLASRRGAAIAEGVDPYLFVLLPYDRKGGAFLPPGV